MKLDAPDGMGAVPHAVNLQIVVHGRGGDFQRSRQRGPLDDQRMVAHHPKRAWKAFKESTAVVADKRSLTVHDATRCADHLAAVRRADSLVPEANAKNRHRWPELPDEWDADAGVCWRTGPGREHNRLGAEPLHLVDGDRVVPLNAELLAKLAEVLDEVVGKRESWCEPSGSDALSPNQATSSSWVKLPMHRPQVFAVNVGVDLRRRDVDMPEHFLNGTQVSAALE